MKYIVNFVHENFINIYDSKEEMIDDLLDWLTYDDECEDEYNMKEFIKAATECNRFIIIEVTSKGNCKQIVDVEQNEEFKECAEAALENLD